MSTPEKSANRRTFNEATKSSTVKIQVGVRREKIDPTWTAIDLYDTSDLIDHNWDIQNLPIETGTVDAFVCNAVLEHVPRPQLAVYEMHRALKVGGRIWVEVPFLQFYHAHPYDFTRWTHPGIRLLMEDFHEVKSGIAVDAMYEVPKYIRYANSDAKMKEHPFVAKIASWYLRKRHARWKNPRFYSSVYFWGEKTDKPLSAEKIAYMESLKTEASIAATEQKISPSQSKN